jgi:hypothetical protein
VRPFDAHVDVQSGVAHLLHELVETLQAGLRLERQALVGTPHDAEEVAQLDQGLPPGAFDGGQHFPGGLVAIGEDALLGGGLNHDDGQAVGDDVVQFSRDAGPLVHCRALGLLVSLRLLRVDETDECRSVLLPPPQRPSGRPGEGVEQPGVDIVGYRTGQHGGQVESQDRRSRVNPAKHRPSTIRVRRHRVDGDEEDQEGVRLGLRR